MMLKLAVAALVLGLVVGSSVMGWYRDSVEKALMDEAKVEQAKQTQRAEKTIQEVMNKRAKIKVKWRTKYEKVYVDMPSDTECLDDAGLQLWNEANIAAKANVTTDPVPDIAATH